MPTFTEYLLAPWKLFGILGNLLAGPPAGIAAAGGAVPGYHGGLCGWENVGDQVLYSCHIAGYAMPGFVFWASLVILTLFIAASSGLMLQCTRVALALNRLAEQAGSKLAGRSPGAALSHKDLGTLRFLMQKEPLVSHAWRLFEDTLIVASHGEEVYGTQPVEAVLTKAALIEENVHSALFNAIPGVLTGLGLLMTFVAILDGLSHVSVAANMDVKGIGGLINGLSGKFISSIVAVTCAVCFVFVERVAYARPTRAYRQLIGTLSGCFRRMTSEHLLFQIQSQLFAQSVLQKELAQALAQLKQQAGDGPALAGEAKRGR